MINILVFDIKSTAKVSKEFINRNILTFSQAASFVRNLPYGRNIDKSDFLTLFSDNCGTCSTKHALIKRLADENNVESMKLIVGLFKMNKMNTPKVASTLKKYNLEYIPEAHCYLKYEDQIIDLTTISSNSRDFIDELIEEIEISPDQISDYKVNYHRNYLVTWLENNRHIKFSLSDIWQIREQCIRNLAGN